MDHLSFKSVFGRHRLICIRFSELDSAKIKSVSTVIGIIDLSSYLVIAPWTGTHESKLLLLQSKYFKCRCSILSSSGINGLYVPDMCIAFLPCWKESSPSLAVSFKSVNACALSTFLHIVVCEMLNEEANIDQPNSEVTNCAVLPIASTRGVHPQLKHFLNRCRPYHCKRATRTMWWVYL